MFERLGLLGVLLLALLVAPARAADVTGAWSVTISTTYGTITGKASPKQAGETVAGWVGPNENDPIPTTGVPCRVLKRAPCLGQLRGYWDRLNRRRASPIQLNKRVQGDIGAAASERSLAGPMHNRKVTTPDPEQSPDRSPASLEEAKGWDALSHTVCCAEA